jgi:hypothetical protein
LSLLHAGLWDLKLAAGRSRDMYDVVDIPDLERVLGRGDSHAIAHAPSLDSLAVLLHSLSGAHLLLPLRKRPEFKGQDVLAVSSHSFLYDSCMCIKQSWRIVSSQWPV